MLSNRLQSVSQSGEGRTYTDLKVSKAELPDKSTPVSAKEDQKPAGIEEASVKDVNTENSAVTGDEGKEVLKTDNGVSAQDTQTINTEDKDLDDCIRAIEILNTLLQGIADILQVTTDQLQGCYEQLDIEPAEMFTVTSIQMTVVTFEGLSDTSDLLNNGDAFDLFNRINEFVRSVFEEAGMDLPEFEEIITSDMFAEFVGPVETGSAEEILQKFTFDENGKLIVNRDREDNTGIQNVNADEEPFTVEVNVENTSRTENGQNETGAGNDSNSSLTGRSESSRSEKSTVRTTLSPAESFVAGLENAVRVTDINMPIQEGVTVRDIVYQVVEAIRVNISNESTSLEMNLNPENLGRVNLNIESRNGVMTAQITTENETARAALESQLQILKDNFEAQGVRVEAIEVTVSSFTFSDSRNAQSEAREHPEDAGRVGRTRRGGSENTEEIPAEETARRLEQEVMEQNGSTVNYTA